MDQITNPYAPGAGLPPVALVGRDEPLAAWDVAIQRMQAGRPARSAALYGLGGVGKTVLLTRFRAVAEERGWIVAQIEAGSAKSLRESLADALHGPLAKLARPSAGRRLIQALQTALSFRASVNENGTWSFGLDLSQVPMEEEQTRAFLRWIWEHSCATSLPLRRKRMSGWPSSSMRPRISLRAN